MFRCNFNACAFETRWREEHHSRFGRGRVRGMLSVTATPDLHFWISISFWKIAERTNPRPFQFVLASPWEPPAVPYSARHAVTRSSASTRVDNKEASPPGTYLIVFSFSRSHDHELWWRWRRASSRCVRRVASVAVALSFIGS